MSERERLRSRENVVFGGHLSWLWGVSEDIYEPTNGYQDEYWEQFNAQEASGS